MLYEQAKNLKSKQFKRRFGVAPQTFNQMVEVVRDKIPSKKKSGRPIKLSLENQVLVTLEYWREYRTYFHIGTSWEISESTACRIVHKIENLLIRSPIFHLPGKKKLLQRFSETKVAVIDVTETPIERPKKAQKHFYSGQKKQHTLKTQLVVDEQSQQIICTAYSQGRRHDYQILKISGVRLKEEIEWLADKGYQGLEKVHSNSQTPKKKPRKGKLSQEDKQFNRELAQRRIIVEHINRKLKIFRILKERYRNRRRRFGLRCNLIAALYNYELNVASGK